MIIILIINALNQTLNGGHVRQYIVFVSHYIHQTPHLGFTKFYSGVKGLRYFAVILFSEPQLVLDSVTPAPSRISV